MRFETSPSKRSKRGPVTHEGRVCYVDFALGSPHKAPTVFYEGVKANGEETVFKNRASMLVCTSKPKKRGGSGH